MKKTLMALCFGILAAAGAFEAAQVAEMRKAAAQLPKTWGDRWYILQANGVPHGYLRLKVEARDGKLLLTDEMRIADLANSPGIRNEILAEPNEFLSPRHLNLTAQWPEKAWKVKAEIRDGKLMVLESEDMGKEGDGGQVPPGFTTDFSVFRLVSVLPPKFEACELSVMMTMTKPRLLEKPVLKFAGEETIDHDGRKVSTRRYVLASEREPDRVFWVDAQGRLLRWKFSAEAEAVLADEPRARKAAEQAAKNATAKAEKAAARVKQPRDPRSEAKIPVFPGAEGFGTKTPAGRGGKVIEVTTLADSGPGSLREALNTKEPCTIVFRVGGTIEMKEGLFIQNPFVTIAGQTAPGEGIVIKDHGLSVVTHDVLLQHLRIRPGNSGSGKPEDNDALCVLGPNQDGADGAYNVVLDHLSLSWSEDEILSTWYGAADITISSCIFSEALNKSRHEKGTHSAGVLIGDGSQRVSLHHNLFAHNDFRNPLISNSGSVDCVNNLIYNWGGLAGECYDRNLPVTLNFIGNVYVPGPSTLDESWELNCGNPKVPHASKIYVEDNLGPHCLDGRNPWSVALPDTPRSMRADKPFAFPPVTRLKAAEVKEKVLAAAGAFPWQRDAVDKRIVTDVREKKGRIINSPSEVGGYPKLAQESAPEDADHDGMADAWERRMGFNPADATDGNKDHDGDGYTNLEEYLSELTKRK